MKKLFFLCMICSVMKVTAQQKPYYTQYILNNYILNPALSGIESYTDVKLSYRNQWTGIEGAPVTTYFSIQGPLGHSDNIRTTPTSFEKAGVNTMGKDYLDDYTAPDPHSGVGMIIMNDKTGYISRFSMYGTYAYHKPLGTKTTLSLGFLAGFTNISLDQSKVVLGDIQYDDAIGYTNGELKKFQPEIGAGLWLYSKNYYLGLSALNIVPGKVKFAKTSNTKVGTYYVPTYFVSAGYRFLTNGDISILPSVSVQSVSPFPLQIHANIKFQYQDLLWFGGSYRITDELGGYAIMAGVNIAHTINIGYAYDVSTTSRLRAYAGDTHEIIVGFLLNNKYGDSCPRNVW